MWLANNYWWVGPLLIGVIYALAYWSGYSDGRSRGDTEGWLRCYDAWKAADEQALKAMKERRNAR